MKFRNDIMIPLYIACFTLGIMIHGCQAKADVLLSVTGKYGVSGYNTSFSPSSSNSSTTMTGHGKNSSTSTTYTFTNGSLDVSNRYQLVPGLMLQTLPEKRYDLSFGAGAYLDSTVDIFVGIRL